MEQVRKLILCDATVPNNSVIKSLLQCLNKSMSFAETWRGNGLVGVPLTQMLTYTLHHACSEEVDSEIVKRLVTTKAQFDVNVISTLVFVNESTSDYCEWCSIIELCIDNRRMDIAKQLVIAGANAIHPCLDNVSGVVQLLEEYYEFGTNEYMHWLLHQHLLSHELPQFIKTVVGLDIFNESGERMFSQVGRHPAHAVLTCGHEEMIRQFLDVKGWNLLYVKDVTERTALHISAQNGDLESVKTLLKL